MKRMLLAVACGLCACLMLINSPSPAYGLAIAIQLPAPAGQRLARADATVVGTVTSIEEKTVSAPLYPNSKEKVEYFVATVKVEDALNGAKGLTHIKVAFLAPMKQPPQGDPKQPIRPIRPFPGQMPPTLTKGQEALLFLKQHHSENFYIMAQFDDLIDKKADDYKANLELAKKAAKTIDDPVKALKADSKEDRFTAVSTMIARYRTVPTGTDPNKLKQEEISAEESKLILNAIAEGDWNPKVGGPRGGFQAGFSTPIACFQALGVTEKDGWKFTGGNFQEAAQKWLKDNADKYRVKKYVVEEKK